MTFPFWWYRTPALKTPEHENGLKIMKAWRYLDQGLRHGDGPWWTMMDHDGPWPLRGCWEPSNQILTFCLNAAGCCFGWLPRRACVQMIASVMPPRDEAWGENAEKEVGLFDRRLLPLSPTLKMDENGPMLILRDLTAVFGWIRMHSSLHRLQSYLICQ